MHDADYLSAFKRCNLLSGAWGAQRARDAANMLTAQAFPAQMFQGGVVFVLLGRKVWDAFFPGVAWTPFTRLDLPRTTYLALPHPSGLNRAWNDLDSYARARKAVADAAPHVAPLLGLRNIRTQ